jgi:hypothetical protein
MNKFQEKPASAIKLRGSKKHEEARQLLLELHAEFPEDLQVKYQCAWIHDLPSLEKEAVPFYEKAVQAVLRGDELKSALPGMGSNYRFIDEYARAMEPLLNSLVNTSNDEGILGYPRAIRFYSDKLNQTW